MKISKQLKFKAGFSIMEILVVLFIVSTAMLGIVSLIIQNIQVQSINKNNLIASSLAQEGIELIRNVRDTNWKNGDNFDTNLSDGFYRIDYRSSVPVSEPLSAKIYLKDGFYVNDNGGDTDLTPTVFSRQIAITRLNTEIGKPLKVKSIISWTDRNHPYRYELQTLLYDWR